MTDPALIQRYHVARSFYESLMKSQWLPQERILAYQERQLQQMLAHAHAQVPFYGEPLGRIRKPDGSFDLGRWNELPIISRSVVEADWNAFQARELPRGHDDVLDMTTSGSEGTDRFSIRSTRFAHTGVACASFRYADWFGHSYSTPLAMIRAGFIHAPDPDDPEDKLWGPPWIDASLRSPRHRLHISAPLDVQLQWLQGLGEVLVNTLPSHAMALAQASEAKGITLRIAGVLTVGEKLTRDVRDEVRRIWGCRMSDVYATAETGLVAIECPDTGAYHLQTEISRIEILKEDGRACAPGEQGQLVATSLYNFAMPLIRYRFNDLVTAGEPCACGRGLPVLSDIAGRKKNLFRRKDGTLFAPDVSTLRIRKITGAREWQLLQTAPEQFRITLKLEHEPDADQAANLIAYLCGVLGPVSIETGIRPSFPRTMGGKFYPHIVA